MKYKVVDAASEETVAVKNTEILALADAASRGGKKNGFHVFPCDDDETLAPAFPVTPAKVVEQKKPAPTYGPEGPGLFD